jgi:hypothetical protein
MESSKVKMPKEEAQEMTNEPKRIEEIQEDVIDGGCFSIPKTAIDFLLAEIDKRDKALNAILSFDITMGLPEQTDGDAVKPLEAISKLEAEQEIEAISEILGKKDSPE